MSLRLRFQSPPDLNRPTIPAKAGMVGVRRMVKGLTLKQALAGLVGERQALSSEADDGAELAL